MMLKKESTSSILAKEMLHILSQAKFTQKEIDNITLSRLIDLCTEIIAVRKERDSGKL